MPTTLHPLLPTISRAQLTTFCYHRQHFDWVGLSSTHPLTADLVGIYGTAPTCYLSLLARDAVFRFADLDTLLYDQRQLIRLRAMRYSVFLVDVASLPAVFQATRIGSKTGFDSLVEKSGVSSEAFARMATQIEEILDTASLTVSELKKALAPQPKTIETALNMIVARLCAQGRLVRTRVRGGWKSDLCEYTRFYRWLPRVDLHSVSPAEARAILARLYFDSYGPATAEDFRWWSGLTKSETVSALAAVQNELTAVKIAGLEGEFLLPQTRLESLLTCPDELPHGVRLLPVWDAYLMAYKNRVRYLTDEWYDLVYDKAGNATSIVLRDGLVDGVWQLQEEKKTLTLQVALFTPPDATVWVELRGWLARLAEVIGYSAAQLVHCPLPPPLSHSGQNRFQTPLKEVAGQTVFSL